MQKQLTQIEVKICDKVYQFICDPDSPLAHVKEALFHVIKHVISVQEKIESEKTSIPEQDAPIQEIKSEE